MEVKLVSEQILYCYLQKCVSADLDKQVHSPRSLFNNQVFRQSWRLDQKDSSIGSKAESSPHTTVIWHKSTKWKRCKNQYSRISVIINSLQSWIFTEICLFFSLSNDYYSWKVVSVWIRNVAFFFKLPVWQEVKMEYSIATWSDHHFYCLDL